MPNPITHLTDKTFEELTYNEILDVANAYCDENRYTNYFYSEPLQKPEPKHAIAAFERTIGNIGILKEYFKYWTE